MGSEEQPLTERLKDKLSDLVEEIVGVVEAILRPPPEPVRIPARKRYRR